MTKKELEKDKQYFSDSLDKQIEATLKLLKDYQELKEKLANADYQLEGRDNEIRELENQQKIDAEHILTLQNEKGELTDRVKELEAQIEKMKLCANCKHCGVSGWCDKLNRYLLDKANQSCGNWEIKENG